MKELSLNILDVAKNSVKARAKNIIIEIAENGETLVLEIKDDGCGMDAETVKNVMDPFFTTRTTRSVGLGIPLLKLAAEQTGGNIAINSVSELDDPENHGTSVVATFYVGHLDFTPLGDIVSTITILIQGSPDVDWTFVHKIGEQSVELDTKELREVLGDVPLDNYEVIKWIEDYLKDSYASIKFNKET